MVVQKIYKSLISTVDYKLQNNTTQQSLLLTACSTEIRSTWHVIPKQIIWATELSDSILPHCGHNVPLNKLAKHLPNKVQNMPPSTGSGSDANKAVNFPMVPKSNIMIAPYCTTRLLPTCTETRDVFYDAFFFGKEKHCICGTAYHFCSTLVIPSTPILGLEEVEPFPVPSKPAMMQHTPSVKIPLTRTESKSILISVDIKAFMIWILFISV